MAIFAAGAFGQSTQPLKAKQPASYPQVMMRESGKVAVVIIKSAAKMTWATTKFAAKDVAKPMIVGIAKPLLMKALPKVSMFALKLTGDALKKGIPFASKLGLAYLKAKLPI